MDGFRNGASTGNASTNTRGGSAGGGGGGGYYNNNKNRNKFNGRRNGGGAGGAGGGGGANNGANGNANRMPNSPSKQQMPNQHSPTHYSNGTGSFSFNSDYTGTGYQSRNNDGQRNYGNKFNSNGQNSPNAGNGKKNNKFNNKRRGGGNYGSQQSYNNYQQGNNLNGYGQGAGQMNRSLSKESPNGSFNETGSNIPTSISLDNFEARQRSPVMTSSFSFTNGTQSPSYSIKPFVPTATISEQEATVEVGEEATSASQAGDATSFYGSPMSHNEATLSRQSELLNTTPTRIADQHSTDDDSSVASPTVVSKDESKSKTDDQISTLSSSSSPDSRNTNNDETSESQLLVTASEGEMSFGTDEPSNVENTIMNPNDSAEHESLNNLMVNTKITDIDEFMKQQSDVMSTLMASTTTKMAMLIDPETTATETSVSGVVNYNNANNDELDGKVKTPESHEHCDTDKKAHDEHNSSTSSSSSSSSTSTTMSSTTTSSPQSSIDPSSSSSSSTSFSNQEKNSDAKGCLDKDAINIRLEIEYDASDEKTAPKDGIEKTTTGEDMTSVTHSTSALYPSLQSNAISEMDTIIHQSSEAQKDEEVSCLVSKLVSDVISQAIQTAPAPMAYDEIEMDDDDDDDDVELVKPQEKGAANILVAFDNDHGFYHRNQDGQEQETIDMSQRESILNLKKIDEDEEDTDKLCIDVDEQNVSFNRAGNDEKRQSIERGHMNSPTGEVDLTKMEAMNSALAGKPASVEAKAPTSKSAKKSQEPVVDCFSCNII